MLPPDHQPTEIPPSNMEESDDPRGILRGWSEFGRALGELVARSPGGLAAILCDEEGDTIDMAYDPKRLTSLDVELHSAQIAQVAFRTIRSLGHLSLISPVIHVKADRRQLVFGVVAHEYLVTLALSERANVARSRVAFTNCLSKLAAFLR